MNTDVIQKLWGFCNTLRHDGINYGDYIEQLTYLLFLKLADEKSLAVPKASAWPTLRDRSGTDLLDHYGEVLRTLAKEQGILGDIFAGSLSKFREPVNLKKLIALIDETEWAALDVDLKGQAYEGLLQKYAAEQKGAGQYFTPREAIRSVVRCILPDLFPSKSAIRNPQFTKSFTIHDPACGTAGFLIGAYEWLMGQTREGADLRREDRERLQKRTFSGGEIVLETRRLAMMNLYLHEIEAAIWYGDSLAEGPHTAKRYDCVLTNPPFGTKGSGDVPVRDDFTVQTSNKQLNFLQHVIHILKPGGQAAIVLPDNVLFEDHAGRDVRQLLMTDCDLHTILRLPIGTFTPYSPGVKANILFFRKGRQTEEVWIHDLRTNVEKVTKRHPLTANYFTDFEACYHAKPRKETERFRRFNRDEITERDDNLDIFWLKDESLGNADDLPEPEDLVSEAVTQLETALDALRDLALKLQENGKEIGD
jgi:type I restriction enzyme M protein